MKMTLVMLAMTVMKTGVCVAGVRPEAPANWVRPVREFGSVLLGDIRNRLTMRTSSVRRAGICSSVWLLLSSPSPI
jgi:hypothetical protein